MQQLSYASVHEHKGMSIWKGYVFRSGHITSASQDDTNEQILVQNDDRPLVTMSSCLLAKHILNGVSKPKLYQLPGLAGARGRLPDKLSTY